MANVFVDNTKETSTLTGANWQFANASTTVTETGAAGNAVAEVAAGDYIRTNGGLQWYKVASVTDDDNIEITPAFQQGTNTDTAKLNSENGTAVGSDYAHHNQALTDNPRAAGDIVKTRANLTYTYAGVDIVFDDDGTVNNPITLKGASIADDPWSDASDVRPIFDFGSTSFNIDISSDDFWTLERLDFINSTNTGGSVRINSSDQIIVTDCRIYNNGSSAIMNALVVISSGGVRILDCVFDNNYGVHIDITDSRVFVSGCTLDGDTVGGGNSTDIGLDVNSGTIYIKDSTFGVTDAHDTADIRAVQGAVIYGRNIKLASTTEVASLATPDIWVAIEDDEQTHLAFRNWQFTGNLSRTTAVERSGEGGTDWSILGEPNSNCGTESPLFVIGDWLRGIPINLDGSSQTITMWAYADSTGGGWTPDASEFFFEVDYHNGAGDWQQAVSVDTFAAEDQWESFAITVNPDASGPGYLRAVLKDNVAGAKLYIDPEPEFS
jgi:hypothetical protein